MLGTLGKRRIRLFITLLLALAAAGCAKPASEISPDLAIAEEVTGRTCQQLVAERNNRVEQLTFAALRQDRISKDDNIRTFGIPSLFGTIFEGDDERNVAMLKGSLLLAEQKVLQARCTYPTPRPL